MKFRTGQTGYNPDGLLRQNLFHALFASNPSNSTELKQLYKTNMYRSAAFAKGATESIPAANLFPTLLLHTSKRPSVLPYTALTAAERTICGLEKGGANDKLLEKILDTEIDVDGTKRKLRNLDRAAEALEDYAYGMTWTWDTATDGSGKKVFKKSDGLPTAKKKKGSDWTQGMVAEFTGDHQTGNTVTGDELTTILKNPEAAVDKDKTMDWVDINGALTNKGKQFIQLAGIVETLKDMAPPSMPPAGWQNAMPNLY